MFLYLSVLALIQQVSPTPTGQPSPAPTVTAIVTQTATSTTTQLVLQPDQPHPWWQFGGWSNAWQGFASTVVAGIVSLLVAWIVAERTVRGTREAQEKFLHYQADVTATDRLFDVLSPWKSTLLKNGLERPDMRTQSVVALARMTDEVKRHRTRISNPKLRAELVNVARLFNQLHMWVRDFYDPEELGRETWTFEIRQGGDRQPSQRTVSVSDSLRHQMHIVDAHVQRALSMIEALQAGHSDLPDPLPATSLTFTAMREGPNPNRASPQDDRS